MARLTEALLDTPVVLLNGARQTGKSTLALQLAKERRARYLTLDDPAILAAAAADPVGFLAGQSGALVLDEVQRVPDLFLAIKAEVDRNREPGRFLLTGSANVLLLPTIADSLAGRMEIVSLWPLSAAELADRAQPNRVEWLFDGDLAAASLPPCERDAFITLLAGGGFPEAGKRGDARRAAWFDSYLAAVLQRDVRDLARVERLTELPHLLKLLAARSAGLLNLAELSRASGLAQSTLKRYFALLETLFLVYRVPARERNPSKRLVKAPKVFLPDSGLLAHLLDLGRERLAVEPGLPGVLVETFVMSELAKHLAWSQRLVTLSHYRTRTGIEVDFVLENRSGELVGIEVKAGATVSSKDFKGLGHLREAEPDRFRRGIVLYTGRQVVPFGPDLYAVPMSVWWCRL